MAAVSSSPLRPHLDKSSIPAHEGHSVSSPREDGLLVVYGHEPDTLGYSLYILDLDFSRPTPSADDDGAKIPRHLPDPIRSFGKGGCLPSSMRSFISGSRLYLIGGVRCGRSKETYYIDLDSIRNLDMDDESLIQRGPDLMIGRAGPLIIPIGELFYVISPDLSVSSCFEIFDPSTGLWTLVTAELGLRKHLGEHNGRYVIMSYMVDSASIYFSTLSGVFTFRTDLRTWTTSPEDAKWVPQFSFPFTCLQSSHCFVACSMDPSKLFLYPKDGTDKFAKPLVGSFDLLGPYKKHVHFRVNQFLHQVSRGDRFCFVCEGYDLIPYLYGNSRSAKKHIVVHTFELRDAALADAGSLRCSPHYQHQGFSRDLYIVENTGWDGGRILNVFLINCKDFGRNAFKRPQLKDFQK